MKVKIVTDEAEMPYAMHTHIVDVETGEELKLVKSVHLKTDCQTPPTVLLEVLCPHLNLQAELKEIMWAGKTWRLVE